MGKFHKLLNKMRLSQIIVAMEDAQAIRNLERADILKQRGDTHRKEELERGGNIKKVIEQYTDILYYREMFGSKACCKTSNMVDIEIKKLKIKTGNLCTPKENIKMRVVGLGWVDLSTPRSKMVNIIQFCNLFPI